MAHPDDETLAAAASGEPADDELVDHVAGCARCASRVEELTVTAARLRTMGDDAIGDDAPGRGPSPEVWEAVRAATTPAAPSRRVTRSARLPWMAAAAAVGLVVGGGTVALVTASDDARPAAARPDVLGRADLDPVGSATARGAAILTDAGGRRRLTIDMAAPASVPSGHYVEAWLFDPATLDMVSVGVVDAERVTLPVPADLDLDTYTGVDLSVEPLDADPAHATSLAQGPLR